ncbi:MAG: EAL domain-containing protein [Henriciella sp.]
MHQIFSCLRDEHNFFYVVAAVVVCTLGVACSVIVFHRGLQSERGMRQRIWASLSGTVIGTGIWATHFVAMLGYRPGFQIQFDGVTTLVSFVIAITGFIAVSQILITGMTVRRRAVCGVIVTATVATMHYYGMTALKQAALIEYDIAFVTASLIVSFALFSLTYCFGLSSDKRWVNYAGLGMTLLAVASLHFIGMAAITVIPMNGHSVAGWGVSSVTLGSWIVLSVAGIIILAALAAGLDSSIAKLRFRQRRTMSLLVNAASEAILVVNADGRVVEANDAAGDLLNLPKNGLVGQPVNGLLGTALFDAQGAKPEESGERYIEVDGERVPVDMSVRDLEEEKSGLQAITLYDLRERIRNEAHIRKLAYSDQLTGLPNRAAFQKALDELTSASAMSDRSFSVFLIDLDEFKDVNDQFGHGAGDAVLQESASRLKTVFGKKSLVSRLGGDEFAVIYPDGANEAQLQQLGDECVAALSAPILFSSTMIRSSASVGIATGLKWEDPIALMKAADRALYAAKQNGRKRARFYDDDLHARTEWKRSLEVDLYDAVENGEFVLHYQSKVCSDTRTILGYEALIRWNRPGHGMVMPGDFIEIAEQSTIIQDIGRWCIYKACNDAAEWDNDWTVSVNLSARQFMDPNLHATIRDALRKSGIAPERLELEITETALIQNTIVAARILEGLKKLGIQIALDDFGTGYSSMSFVQQFPFDRIKIDRSFVSTMETDRKASAIIDAILLLGSNLSIPVVAEGVETEEQARRLRDAKCGELQGFLISRPQPIDLRAVKRVAAKLKAAS